MLKPTLQLICDFILILQYNMVPLACVCSLHVPSVLCVLRSVCPLPHIIRYLPILYWITNWKTSGGVNGLKRLKLLTFQLDFYRTYTHKMFSARENDLQHFHQVSDCHFCTRGFNLSFFTVKSAENQTRLELQPTAVSVKDFSLKAK